jgi:5S rRNA maturation endonuclease (ribonuclease M5)
MVALLDDLERLEKLEELILELQQMSDKGAVIIVEGQRDRKALRALGITGTIVLGTKKSILVFCEEVAREYKNVIVLTDWDEKGEKLAALMEGYLRSTGAAVNMDIRKKIKNLVQKRIKDIESLDTHISNLASDLKHY